MSVSNSIVGWTWLVTLDSCLQGSTKFSSPVARITLYLGDYCRGARSDYITPGGSDQAMCAELSKV